MDSVLEHCGRGPAEFCHGFGGVNGVALVVAFAVGHVGDQALGLSEFCQDDLYDFDIGFLVVAAEVVDFSDFAFFQYGEDAVAVVFDVKPVADVEALSVDGVPTTLLPPLHHVNVTQCLAPCHTPDPLSHPAFCPMSQ